MGVSFPALHARGIPGPDGVLARTSGWPVSGVRQGSNPVLVPSVDLLAVEMSWLPSSVSEGAVIGEGRGCCEVEKGRREGEVIGDIANAGPVNREKGIWPN